MIKISEYLRSSASEKMKYQRKSASKFLGDNYGQKEKKANQNNRNTSANKPPPQVASCGNLYFPGYPDILPPIF